MKAKRILCMVFFVCLGLKAGEVEWKGLYRVEGVYITGSELQGSRIKSYGLHHLSLFPKIIFSDGLQVQGRVEVLNNNTYPNSLLGDVLGASSSGGTNTNDTATLLQTQNMGTVAISEMYLTFIQEFGAFLVGRVPLQFGLGITHNAGLGDFDHWLDTRDLIGYRIVAGNFYFLPMLGKAHEGTLGGKDDVTDYMVQIQYENPETDLEMGVFYQDRSAPVDGVDFPSSLVNNTEVKRPFRSQTVNLYVAKKTSHSKIGFEGSYLTGRAGLEHKLTGNEVKLSGHAVVWEGEWFFEGSKWSIGGRAGSVSGDDPNTEESYEGYFLDRNYDIAFLLFNHPFGADNLIGSQYVGGGPDSGTGASAIINKPDVEAVTNVSFFVSPYINYQWKEQWRLNLALATGQLSRVSGDMKKDLGYEVDFGIHYQPREKFVWSTQLGFFFPGEAFKGTSAQNYDIKNAFGLTTKAAIRF